MAAGRISATIQAMARSACTRSYLGGRLLGVTVLAVYAALLRPRMMRWGATQAEVDGVRAGEDLIPGARRGATMATTIDAAPATVWPWLVQMGCDRAGFYSWDRLDNGGRASAERIHPEWQALAEGDRVLCVPDGSVWFDVVVVESERTLVLRSSLALARVRHFDPDGPPPRAFNDSTWGFHLSPTEAGATRLVVRGVARGRPDALTRLANWLFWDPAHWVMQTRQFAGLRRRAQAASELPARAPSSDAGATAAQASARSAP
jgi:hypothetical protein